MRKERPVKRKAKDGTSSHRSSPLSYQTLTLRFLLPLHRWGEEGNISHSPLQPSLHPTQSCCLYIYYHTRSSTMCTSLLVSFGSFPTMTIFGFNHYLCTFLFFSSRLNFRDASLYVLGDKQRSTLFISTSARWSQDRYQIEQRKHSSEDFSSFGDSNRPNRTTAIERTSNDLI